jgi:glucose-1-phosphate adenylyltransferase
VVGAHLERAVVGIRSRIGPGTTIRDSLILGADHYETPEQLAAPGAPPVGIGADTFIQNAIIDKNARIGRGVRIVNESGEAHKDGDGYFVREGIVVVPKDGVVPDGSVI